MDVCFYASFLVRGDITVKVWDEESSQFRMWACAYLGKLLLFHGSSDSEKKKHNRNLLVQAGH